MSFGRTTRQFKMSAWNCIKKSFLEAPPSTFSSFNLIPELRSISSRRSLVWYAMDSNAALVICSFDVAAVIPIIIPLAPVFQCGAPSPVNAGTKNTPPLSGILSAITLVLAAWSTKLILSRNH